MNYLNCMNCLLRRSGTRIFRPKKILGGWFSFKDLSWYFYPDPFLEDEASLRNLLSDGLVKNHQLEMVCH